MWEREDSLVTEVGEDLHDIMEQLQVLRDMLAVCIVFSRVVIVFLSLLACLSGVRVFSFFFSKVEMVKIFCCIYFLFLFCVYFLWTFFLHFISLSSEHFILFCVFPWLMELVKSQTRCILLISLLPVSYPLHECRFVHRMIVRVLWTRKTRGSDRLLAIWRWVLSTYDLAILLRLTLLNIFNFL